MLTCTTCSLPGVDAIVQDSLACPCRGESGLQPVVALRLLAAQGPPGCPLTTGGVGAGLVGEGA